MEDTKVQLNSRKDIEYVFHHLKSHALQKLDKRLSLYTSHQDLHKHQSEINAYFENVFGKVKDNVQVNGLDLLDSMPQNDQNEQLEEFEPLNENLKKELAEAQSKFESLLLSVINKRKLCPSLIPKSLSTSHSQRVIKAQGQLEEECEKIAESSTWILKKLSDIEERLDDHPDAFSTDLSESTVELLSSLDKSVPKVIEKLERANQVLIQENEALEHL